MKFELATIAFCAIAVMFCGAIASMIFFPEYYTETPTYTETEVFHKYILCDNSPSYYLECNGGTFQVYKEDWNRIEEGDRVLLRGVGGWVEVLEVYKV